MASTSCPKNGDQNTTKAKFKILVTGLLSLSQRAYFSNNKRSNNNGSVMLVLTFVLRQWKRFSPEKGKKREVQNWYISNIIIIKLIWIWQGHINEKK